MYGHELGLLSDLLGCHTRPVALCDVLTQAFVKTVKSEIVHFIERQCLRDNPLQLAKVGDVEQLGFTACTALKLKPLKGFVIGEQNKSVYVPANKPSKKVRLAPLRKVPWLADISPEFITRFNTTLSEQVFITGKAWNQRQLTPASRLIDHDFGLGIDPIADLLALTVSQSLSPP
jgi:hypothetical protein